MAQKILGHKIAFAAQQLYAKIRFQCCVVEEKKSVQDLGKKKEKENNLIAAKSGLVKIKGYLKTYNRVKYFFVVINPFLIETAFHAKIAWRFLDPKTTVT